MRAYIGVTDLDWYRLLSSLPDLDEVNFWQPGGTRVFRALSVGDLFLFKLHSPRNYIVGGGFFAHANLVELSVAWGAFGIKNGVESLGEMRQRIGRLRRVAVDAREDYRIGCIILEQPFFLEERDWIPAPGDFHPNVVQGKRYDLTVGEGARVWESLQGVLARRALLPGRVAEAERDWNPESPMFTEFVLARRRLGQGAFRILITDTYERRCAVTRERILPILDAAHIRPVSEGGVHRLDNGLLLRTDIHTLFDRGYVTVTPSYRFRVSRRLKQDFENGRHYYELEGSTLWLPPSIERRPARELLEWHGDTVFLE